MTVWYAGAYAPAYQTVINIYEKLCVKLVIYKEGTFSQTSLAFLGRIYSPWCRINCTTYIQELEINKIIKYLWMHKVHWCKHASKSITRLKNSSLFSPRLYSWRQYWYFRNKKCDYIALLYQYSPHNFQVFIRYCPQSKHIYGVL